MDGGILTLVISGAVLVGGAIGWLVRQFQQRKEAKRRAANDAGNILKERKKHLEDMISKTGDNDAKQILLNQLDEVNALLLGLYTKRGRTILEEAGLPPEEILIAEGRSQLQPQQTNQLKGITEELTSLPAPLSIESLSILASAYYYTLRYQDAKCVLDKILSLNPNDATALNNRGVLYEEFKRYEEALADFSRSLELSPDDPATLNNRGVTHSKLKRYKEALADYNRSLELRPDYPDTLDNRGTTHSKLKGYKEALADFSRSLELRPDNGGTLYNLACLFSLWGKTDDALAYLEKAIDKDKKWCEDAKTDEDFENIRNDPRFKKLIKSE